MEIRPLEPDEAGVAADVSMAALGLHDEPSPEARVVWMRRRIAHVQRTDPQGAWAAEQDGELVGVALALVRDGLWGLSLMAVRPDLHARGIGRGLLEATLTHEGGGRGALITSSTDPRAMRLYARAGFDLHPCVAAAGILDRATLPAGLRSKPTDDLEQAGAFGAPVRGAAYAAEDLAMLQQPVLLLPGRGFAAHRDGSPIVVCATDDEAAADLLWSCLAAAPPGGTVDVDFITAGQDWAIGTALQAGLVLTPVGPVYARGTLGPLRPWLPSGSLL